MKNKKMYAMIDVGRLLAACFIPLLHIDFGKQTILLYSLTHYISRIGVPFFFAVSGMFLRNSINNRGGVEAWHSFSKRIAILMGIWFPIYFPIICVMMRNDSAIKLIQEIIFRTPAFLWYLTALLVASIPFCFLKNRKLLYVMVLILYLWGTLYGESYTWLTGGCEIYDDIFITTRNGIFFALPMMCVGECAYIINAGEKHTLLLISVICWCVEITLLGVATQFTLDGSMYISLPILVFALLYELKERSLDINTAFIRKISSAIYLMQFGIIYMMSKLFSICYANSKRNGMIIYLLVLIMPCIFCYFIKDKKLMKYIF